MGGKNRVSGVLLGDPMSEMVDLGVRDVPALTHAGPSPPAGFGRHHFQSRSNPHHALNRALAVLAGGLEESLNASETVDRFSLSSIADGTRHPERLPTRQATITLLEHGPDFRAFAGHDEVRSGAVSQKLGE